VNEAGEKEIREKKGAEKNEEKLQRGRRGSGKGLGIHRSIRKRKWTEEDS